MNASLLLISILVLAAGCAALGFAFSRKSAALRELAAVAGKVRAGDLSARVGDRFAAREGSPGSSLNAMLDRLNGEFAQLRKLERVRSEFLGNVSHELRTPIFAIQGMLETLLRGALEDPSVNRDFVERALRNTQQLNVLLRDLIEISRIESGEMKLSFRYFSLHEFLSGIADEMRTTAEQRGIALRLEDAASGVQVLGDKERLKQVMVNLIDNAVKYNTQPGSVIISSSLADGGMRIAVSDTGPGIPADHLPRIFERFYRVDKERSREAGGTGLGLAIVKHIVEAHGSRIEVRSKPGSGSTFSFTLKT